MTTSVDSGLGRTSLSLRNKSYGLHSAGAAAPERNSSFDFYACSADLATLAQRNAAAAAVAGANANVPSSTHPQLQTRGSLPAYFPANQKSTKQGTLEKCKAVEAGKKLKKQWVTCFVYLTGAHLIFYKDEKSSEKRGNHYPAPLGVCDLRGAQLSWTDGDRKHKHVFNLELIDGTVYLFSCADTQEVNSWFHAVRQLIAKLPQPDLYPPPVPVLDATAVTRRSLLRNHSSNAQEVGVGGRRQHATTQSMLDVVKTNQPQTKKQHSNSMLLEPSSSSSSEPSASSSNVESKKESRQTILDRLKKFFRSRPTLESLKEKGIYKPEPVFGSSLVEICKREKTTVPKFIRSCAALVEEKGLEVDGLYRISGNLSQIQKIRCQVDQDKYTLLDNEGDIHVVTGALKLFFRELSEPLFPVSMTKEFLAAIKIQKPKQRLKEFRELLGRMPRPHHDTLQFLLTHLLRVASESRHNRMQVHNLAIVFGPTLFNGASEPSARQKPSKNDANGKTKRSKSTQQHHMMPAMGSGNVDVVQSNSHLAFNMIMQGQIVEYLLKECHRFFDGDTAPSTSTSSSQKRLAILPPSQPGVISSLRPSNER